MLYLFIGLVVIVVLFLLLKISAKKFNTLESEITYFYQAIELEYFLEFPDSKIETNVLDKAFLGASGYFYSLKKTVEWKLSLDEIELIANYAIEQQNGRGNRLLFFIVLYKVAGILKENGGVVSIMNDSEYLKLVEGFDYGKIEQVVNNHLLDKSPPVGHYVLTKRMLKNSPEWFSFKFND